MLAVGDRVDVTAGKVAHGGFCVARVDGQVVFVNGTLPDEHVSVEIDKISGKVAFGRARGVHQASGTRITPPCPHAGYCGGCDWQHTALAHQRALKSEVLREQLTRLGGVRDDDPLLSTLEVGSLPGDETGLGWRTRVNYSVDTNGRLGFRVLRSRKVVAIEHCPIAHPHISSLALPSRPGSTVRAVVSSAGTTAVHPNNAPTVTIAETVGQYRYQLDSGCFWQAHQQAPQHFVTRILALLAVQAGMRVLDLYAGVGLFTVPLAQKVTAKGSVEAIEGNRDAATWLRKNTLAHPQVVARQADVAQGLHNLRYARYDAVVLDPPRSGAGREVVAAVCHMQPQTVVYVACDPAAFARDVGYFAKLGYRLDTLEAWDAFPMTHHFETIGKLVRI
jgi:tRNA/tmRNA/rRNA uracil-C5-methylase (TrmA/RlmC/RlmD family)